MSLIDYIENLRNKPEMDRRRILVGTTFSIVAIIFFIWVSVRLSGASNPSPAVISDRNRGPIAEVGEVVGSAFQSFSSGIAAIKGMFSSTTSATSTVVK